MECLLELCIYWENKCCTLKNISVNRYGMCDDCILISFDEDMLQKRREEILAYYDKEYSADSYLPNA